MQAERRTSAGAEYRNEDFLRRRVQYRDWKAKSGDKEFRIFHRHAITLVTIGLYV